MYQRMGRLFLNIVTHFYPCLPSHLSHFSQATNEQIKEVWYKYIIKILLGPPADETLLFVATCMNTEILC